jgi:HK97 family phage major capsid protein/HK97 family phage prohead protease
VPQAKRQLKSIERAYSLLEVKAFDDDERVITGIATTPTPDRMGDIVESDGAEFKLPIPLLSQHDSTKPIGHVTKAKITKAGIEITAKLVKPEPGAPQSWADRLNEAWADIKSGLVRGLSIGFKPVESTIIEGTWSYRFVKWLWLELSAVTIPANLEAEIETVKSLSQSRASLGNRAAKSPGASGTRVVSLKSIQESNMAKKSFAEQIRDFQNARAAKMAQLEELMGKSVDSGETLDDAAAETYENLQAEIETIDKHLKRLARMEQLAAGGAEVVRSPRAVARANGQDEETEQEENNERRTPIIRAGKENVPKGVGFARLVKCIVGAKKGGMETAQQMAKRLYPSDERLHTELKAAVAAGTTTDAGYAGNLVYPENLAGEFIDFLRPQTILGKFGNGGVPALRQVPFNIRIPGMSAGANGYWVGQGAPKPLTRFTTNVTNLGFAKIAAIAVLTDELIRFSSPNADLLARDELAKAIRERSDIDFIDPAKAAAVGVSPASITNGVTPITASGTTEDALRADLAALWDQFLGANLSPADAVYIMSNRTALRLSLMVNPLGQPSFPGMTMNGGTLLGVPVIASEYVPADTAGGLIILVKASEILLADDGQVTVDASNEASLQMDDAPTNPPAAATVLVSMFQMNMTALRAERFINWAKARAQSVAYLQGANYG